jgi:Ca2+-binding EF-hand superfamily protein
MPTDKKYNRLGYTGLGTGMQDRLIKGAYLSARADAPDYSWMNAVSSGINAFGEEMETKKANKKAEHDEIMGQIQTNVDEIYAAGGSMPQEYFDQAFTYTEQLREEYFEAVQSGDVKKQHQIKAKLNTFSTGIQNTKKSLEEGATLIKDDMLINSEGLTPEQKNIMNSIKKGTAELDMESGSYKWRAVDVNGEPILDENGQQKYYTEEDYDGALVMRDDVNKEAYLSANKTHVEGGDSWRNGEGPEFDNETSRKANIKIIEASIKENKFGSMQSMIWDDITGFGSFAETIETHPEFVKYFDEDLEHFNMKDGLTNNAAIGLYDKDKDGHVSYADFIDADSYPQYDLDGNGFVSDDELNTVYENDPTARETVTKLAKEKIKHALLNPAKGQEELTKSMLADFMTNRQSQMFYGNKTTTLTSGEVVPTYKIMIPGVTGSNVQLGRMKRGKMKTSTSQGSLFINGAEITSPEQYVDAGGSWGYLQSQGYTYDNDKKVFKYVKPDLLKNVTSGKYDNN